jgi:hypothetical protein
MFKLEVGRHIVIKRNGGVYIPMLDRDGEMFLSGFDGYTDCSFKSSIPCCDIVAVYEIDYPTGLSKEFTTLVWEEDQEETLNRLIDEAEDKVGIKEMHLDMAKISLQKLLDRKSRGE